MEQEFSRDEDHFRLGATLFWRWLTPPCVARCLDDGGDDLRAQLVPVWQAGVEPLVGSGEFPGAALFQTIVLSDAAIRLKPSGRFPDVVTELGHTAGRQRIRSWLLLLQALLQSVQKVQLALAQAHPRLAKQEREQCKAVRERCTALRGEWRDLHTRLKELRTAAGAQPGLKV
jgi:hypothetical protein